MARYSEESVRTRFDGKLIYNSVIYPIIPQKETDIIVTARVGDRLDLLAYKYYNNKNDWWIIAVASELNQGSLHVEPGTQLRIPIEVDDIIQDYNRINS